MAGTSKAAWTASRARAWSSVNSSNALVGMLAPARPSPTRAGVRPRRSTIERDDGAGIFICCYSAGTDASRSRIE